MNRILFLLATALFLIPFFTCTAPSDPDVPGNAKPEITAIEGKTDSLSFDDGETVLMQVGLSLIKYIDSILISVSDTSGDVDTQFTVKKDDLDEKMSFHLTLNGVGVRLVKITSYASDNSTRTDTMKVVLRGVPVEVAGQPEKRIVAVEGERIVIAVEIGGSEPYSGNWYHDGEMVEEATGDSLVLDSVTADDGGSYFYFVENGFSDGDTSDECRLVVTEAVAAGVVAVNDTVETDEDSVVIIDVLLNDMFPAEENVVITGVTQGESGTAEYEESTVTYTPYEDESGMDSITYTLNDSVTATVYVTVNAVQNKPQIVCPSSTSILESNEDRIVAYGTDPDGEEVLLWTDSELSYVETDTDNDSLLITIAPETGYLESDSTLDTITVFASDGIDTVSHNLAVTVRKAYRKPEFVTADTFLTLNEGDSIRLDLIAIEYNGYQLSWSVDEIPSWVTSRTLHDTLRLTFKPSKGLVPSGADAVSDSVIASVTNGRDTVFQKVDITLNGFVNTPPQFTGLAKRVEISENESFTFTPEAMDSDGDVLTYGVSAIPDGGTFEDGTFSWTPDFTRSGEYVVPVQVSDGIDTTMDTVTITVINVNRPPVITPVEEQLVYAGSVIKFTVAATDPDDDQISFSAAGRPSGALFDSETKEFFWQTDYDQWSDDPYVVTFIADDGDLADTENVEITVRFTNRVPVFTVTPPVNDSAKLGSVYTTTIAFNDPDDQTLSVTVDDTADSMTYVRSGNSLTLSWNVHREIYTVGYEDTVTVSVDDGVETVRYSWYVEVRPHVWTRLADMSETIRLLVAKDGDQVFAAHQTNLTTPYSNYDIYRLNGSNAWEQFHRTEFTGGNYKRFTVVDDALYAVGLDNTGTQALVRTIALTDGTSEDVITLSGVNMSGDVTAAAERIAVEYNSTGPDMPSYLKYVSTTTDTGIGIATSFLDLQFGDDEVLYGRSSDGIYRMTEFDPADTNGGFIRIVDGGYDNLFTIRDNADTIYLLDGNTLSFVGNAASISSAVPTVVQDEIMDVAMLSGKVGWAITTDSTVIFTNDGFATVTQEIPEEGDAGQTVKNVVIAADREAVYLYNGVKVFRY